MQNILIVGANGMLGFAVSKYFLENGYMVKKISRSDFDIAKGSDLSYTKLSGKVG